MAIKDNLTFNFSLTETEKILSLMEGKDGVYPLSELKRVYEKFKKQLDEHKRRIGLHEILLRENLVPEKGKDKLTTGEFNIIANKALDKMIEDNPKLAKHKEQMAQDYYELFKGDIEQDRKR